MRKKAHMLSFVLWGVLFGIAFAGCAGAELLNGIPRDFALVRETGALEEPCEKQPVKEQEAVPEPTPENKLSFLMEEAGSYAADSLSETERLWYEDMEQVLGSFGTDAELNVKGLEAGLEEADIDRIFQCVMCDHPELFYVEGYSYTKYMLGEQITSITFSGTYNMDLETALKREQEILAAAGEILAGVDTEASDYDKVKYVYDTIICSTDYNVDALDNQNIYSVFVHRRSVCQGYAKATQYLLNRLGIECALVQGTVRTGEGHAWNLAKVDGAYYYIDTTWGDVSYQVEDTFPEEGDLTVGAGEEIGFSEEGNVTGTQEGASEAEQRQNVILRGMPEINYDYLNVTTQEIMRTHAIGGVVPMPECTAVEANYYRREGAFFTGYDKEQMKALFDRVFDGGGRDVTVKCSDAACYEEIYGALIEGQEIFGYLGEGEKSVAYTQNQNQFSLTFWVTNE